MEVNRNKPPKILFKITPSILNRYHKMSVYLTKPLMGACYERNYCNVSLANKIKYLIVPDVTQYPFDLNDGFESYQRRHEYFHTPVETLKYIMTPAAEGGEGNDDNVDGTERTRIYTRRGTLATIMQSNYVKKYTDWNISVTRYNGNIYMVQTTDERHRMSEQLEKHETHHVRLEKILFSESPHELPKFNEPCNENIRMSCVHRSSLGKYDIVYSGEIQGIIAEEKFEDFNDLEALNKCRFVFTKHLWDTLKNDDIRCLKYWLHAYLANVNDIYVAYKNRDGIVQEPIQHKIVSNMPNNRFWKPKTCTAFLHDFLEHVDNLMSNVNCLNTVYDFNFCSHFKVISYEIYEGKTEKTFLTEEYMNFCMDKNCNY